MTRTRLLTIIATLALALAACTNAEPSSELSTTSSTLSTTTTTAVDNESTSTTEASIDRELELVDCEDPEVDVAIVCEAYDLIQRQYVDEIDPALLAEAAANGLEQLDGAGSDELLVCASPDPSFAPTCGLAAISADNSAEAAEAMVAGLAQFALDPNSAYFEPTALDLLQEEQQGEIQGIGALVSPEDQTIPGDNKQCGVLSETCEILIVSTIDGAPAEAAGLMRDDEIVGVDGESVLGWSVDEVTAAVRGPEGTDVTLTIDRGGELFDVTITRAAVRIPVIETETFGDVGYIRLYNFTGTAGRQFEEAVVDVLSEGVGELVIDFRNNPGGFLSTAIDVTSVFLDDGDVIITQGPDEDLEYSVNGSAIVPDDVPVTVVVNKGSASASEVVAAVLQERGRATVVGENTFGKNTVQQRFGLSNGGALKLTIARWVTPGGLDFGGTGVTPDVELDVNGLDAEQLVEALS